MHRQNEMVQAGYRNVALFTGLADSRADLRAALLADFRIDPATDGAPDRAVAAAIVAAWESAQEYRKRDMQLRAEAKTLNIVRPASSQERAVMRRAVEAAFGPLPPKEAPSNEYLSSKLEEVEADEPTASPLDEVFSLETVESQSLQASVDPSGRLRITKARSKGKMPATTEELRLRLRVESNLWLFLQVKFSNRPWLNGLTPSDFGRYTDYILGEKVFELRIPRENAIDTLQTPWTVLLRYEHECRKAAFRLVREQGLTLSTALVGVMSDSELKEVHFTSPIALGFRQGRGEKRTLDNATSSSSRKQPKPAHKGNSKGKGKGGGKNANLVALTADGRQICFNFNSDKGCADSKCARVHCCRVRGCGGDHPASTCKKRAL